MKTRKTSKDMEKNPINPKATETIGSQLEMVCAPDSFDHCGPFALSLDLNYMQLERRIFVSCGSIFYAWFSVGRPEDLRHYRWYDTDKKRFVTHVLSKKRDPVCIIFGKGRKILRRIGSPVIVYKFVAPNPFDKNSKMLPLGSPLHYTRLPNRKWAYKPLQPTPERTMEWANYCPYLSKEGPSVMSVSGEEG
jgi:hypothetical protein